MILLYYMNSIPTEKATFAAGCFWGVEDLFLNTPGVISTRAGYIGGYTENPTYPEVCTDETGHAEAVEIIFNPQQISYAQLLDIFWQNHNPTTLNQQGPDHGTQYRSAVFYHNPEQAEIAKAKKQALEESGRFKQPIVTEIVPAQIFYPAEEYHQKYLRKRGKSGCHLSDD
jgi:peptide-methionine (S)-S-oxide reductase